MLTPEHIADGWIEWGGVGRPAIAGKVWVMWENGLTSLTPGEVSWWRSWERPARSNKRLRNIGRIIAYKPEQTNAK
jgi:hypothetical protein